MTCRWQRYTGAAGVLVLWTTVPLAMYRGGLGLVDWRPISYLGINSYSRPLFSGGLLVSAALFIMFGCYLSRVYKFSLKNKFFSYLLIGQTGQIIAALVPYKGNFKIIHTVAAFTLAFSLPLLMKQFSLLPATSAHKSLYQRLLRIEQFTFVVGMAVFLLTKGIAPVGEVLPAIGFHIWVVAVTVTKP